MIQFWLNIFDAVSSYLKSPGGRALLFWLELVFVTLTLVFLALSVWLRIKSGFFRNLKTRYSFYLKKTPRLPLDELRRAWQQIALRIAQSDEAQWKLAVIEADNFFDRVLGLLGYQGETLAEKLEQLTSAELMNLEAIWQAHKIRNALVHDSTFELSYTQAENVINTYAQALKHFKVLE